MRGDIKNHQLVRTYLAGNSIKETARIHGMSHHGTYARLKKSGVKIRSVQDGLNLASKKGTIDPWKNRRT